MHRISVESISTLVVVGALLAACSPDQAGPTGSTATPSDTTLPPSTTSSTLATTITQPDSTTTSVATEVGDLLVIGDWGSGTLPQGAVAGAMSRYAEENEVAAILTTGDNFYSDDSEFLMEPFGWATSAGIPFWIAWGNHDVETPKRIETVEEMFDDPPRWSVHEWGAVDVVILDTTDPDEAEQVQFVAETLDGSDDPTIVVTHHPPYSCGTYGNDETVQQLIEMSDDDIFLVLSGHEHNYQRFEEDAVTYVVTGGGGASLTEVAGCSSDGPAMVAGEPTHHFLVLQQGVDFSARVLDVNGQVIDQFSLSLP